MTTTALQSLALLNNEFMLRQAAYFAARITTEPHATSAEIVDRAFQAAFGRHATPDERETGVVFLESAGTAEFCRLLLNANEFVYID